MNRKKNIPPFLSWIIHHSFLMGRFFQKPSGKELLACFAAVTLIGVTLGLVFGALALILPSRDLLAGPWTRLIGLFGKSIGMLVVFSTAFFLFCGIPGVTIVPRTLEMAPSLGRWVRGLLYFAGGSLAMVTGLLLMPAVTGLRLFSWPLIVFIVAVDGIISTIVGAVVFSHKRLEVQIRLRAEALAHKEREALEMRRLVDASKLSALQARINPHFFFNTLNSIAALIPRDPARATETVERLGDLFRYTMKSSEETRVPLSEEIDFVRAYLGIEKLRFGDRLRIVEKVEPNCLDVEVPGLFLQPVVENAVRHGIAPRPAGGTLTLEAGLENDRLRVRVADNGPGLGEADPFRPGHALENIRKRLKLLYGAEATLAAGRNTGTEETEMVFLIPVKARIGK